MAHGLFLVANGEHRMFSAEGSQTTGGPSTEAIGYDGFDIQLVRCLHGLLG